MRNIIFNILFSGVNQSYCASELNVLHLPEEHIR